VVKSGCGRRRMGDHLVVRGLSSGSPPGVFPDHTVLSFPKLSPTMSHGTLTSWKKKEGEAVESGEVLADIETDKATMEFTAEEDGVLAKILVSEGESEVPIGRPMAVMVYDQADVVAFRDFDPASAPTVGSSTTPSSTASGEGGEVENQDQDEPSRTSQYPPHSVLYMPKLSPSPDMTSSVLSKWMKKEGDEIQEGDSIADVETDKAVVSFDVQESGYLAKLLVQEHSEVAIGKPIALMVFNRDDIGAMADFSPPHRPQSSVPEPKTQPPKIDEAAEVSPIPVLKDRVLASPLARKRAKDTGIDLNQLKGSGPGGRIIIADVERSKAVDVRTGPEPLQPPPSMSGGSEFYSDISATKFQQVAARRLTESKQNIPHYYLTMELAVDKMLKLREEVNQQAKSGEYKISVNDFVIKAAAMALLKVPEVNSQWMGDFVRQFHTADISVAVATDLGLITPIVKSADRKGLKAISGDVKSLSQKAKENKLKLEEFVGGTFTVSNLGMLGISEFSAVINPPQAAILAVGQTSKRVVTDGDSTKVASIMTVTLSCDHRVVDGAVGARWLQVFRDHMEDPFSMLL